MRKLRLNKKEMVEVEDRRKALGLPMRWVAEQIGVTLRCYQGYVAEGASSIRIYSMKRALDEKERAESLQPG